RPRLTVPPPPPRPPLFPYTTLFLRARPTMPPLSRLRLPDTRRFRVSTIRAGPITRRPSWCAGRCARAHLSSPSKSRVSGKRNRRSEEHTSELQSLRHLVCRLLLEKK